MTIFTNLGLVQVTQGRHPISGTHPEKIAISVVELRKYLEQHSDNAGSSYRRQYQFLLAGAASYIVWHVVEMYLRAGRMVLNV